MQQEKISKISDEDRLILIKKIIFENFDPLKKKMDLTIKKSVYCIDDNLLELLDYCKQVLDIILENKSLKYEDVPNLLTCDLMNVNKGIIFAIKNHNLKKIKICHTSKIDNMLSYIKFNILLYEIGLKNCFTCFKSENLRDFCFSELENINGNKVHLINREKYWKNIYYPGVSLINNEIDEKMEKLYDNRMKFFYEVLESFGIDFFDRKCNIYKFINVKNGRIYICGYDKKSENDQLIDIIMNTNNQKIKADIELYGINAFKLIKIETFKVKTPIDLMLRIDFNKVVSNSVYSGYNENFCLSESSKFFADKLTKANRIKITKILFLRINMYLFDLMYDDGYSYDNLYGYVYEIKNITNDMKYYGFALKKTIKNLVLDLYNEAINKKDNKNKLFKAFEEEPYTNFQFTMLKRKNDDDYVLNLKFETEKLINENNTIKEGYNIDPKFIKNLFYRNKKNN